MSYIITEIDDEGNNYIIASHEDFDEALTDYETLSQMSDNEIYLIEID